MRIGMVMARHPRSKVSPIMPEVVRLLGEWGATVETIHPEERLTNLATARVEHDLYVLKSGTELALSLAGALHASGAAILNPFPVAAMCRDKVVATRVLHAAGVPVPETFVTHDPWKLAPLLDGGPLVVKPHRGSQGRGVQVVRNADELLALSPDGGVLFAMRYKQPDGPDRKIYCIDGRLFGVKRVWPAKTYEEKVGEPFPLTPELREIALRCGEAFGMELYGLDIVLSDGRPFVVDISSFPGFKGVPDAACRLADCIFAAARRRLDGKAMRASAKGTPAAGRAAS
jgi:ribosomal protein S6--L-glutamate ligase